MKYSTEEALRLILDSRIANVYTAMPGEIVSYDREKQVADVRPVVRRLIPNIADEADDIPEDLPVIPSVPVQWLRAGGFYLHAPLAAGDGVLLVICHSDFAGWRRTGEVSDPGDQRLHSLAHAVAIPGLESALNVLGETASDALVFGKEGAAQVRLTATRMEVDGSSDAAALASKVDQLATAFNNAVTAFNAHIHPAGTPNTGSPATPQVSYSGGASASAKLKVGG